jgi:dTDP-4-amino-4,6-dideoxygalactose transaminase
MKSGEMQQANDFIPYSRPTLGREEEEQVIQVMRSGWLTTGRHAAAFEREFASKIGSRYALAVNSGTAALHLALDALAVQPGDYVITTPYTFTATAEVIRYLDAHPIFVDICEDSYNIDPDGVRRAVKSHRHGRDGRIAAIIPVHIGGDPCKMEELCDISETDRVPIIEDAAHAFPVRYRNRMIGTWGRMAIFSFYANKTITTGEGGMLVTDERKIAERIKIMRLHGIDRDVWNRYTSNGSDWRYDIVEAGYKYNMPDLNAAIGRVQLTRADGFLERRRAIAERYDAAFEDVRFLAIPPRNGPDHAWHVYALRLKLSALQITRDEFMHRLSEEGIGTSVHFIPLHLMTYYRRRYGYSPEEYPLSVAQYERSISLPIYPGLTDEEVDRVIEGVVRIGKRYTAPRCISGSSGAAVEPG